jgi:hypothetical protein
MTHNTEYGHTGGVPAAANGKANEDAALSGKRFAIWFCLFLIAAGTVSCTGNYLTGSERKQIERYVKQEKHDGMLFGKWQSHETFDPRRKGAIGRYLISFDSDGIIRCRHYVGAKPMHDWSPDYYYYTKGDTLFRYRPAEKGLLAMDGEIILKHPYEVTREGNLLIIKDSVHGDKRYTKVEDVDLSF